MRATGYDFGTDDGPTCQRCTGTVWGYVVGQNTAAICVSCGMVEGPLNSRPKPPSLWHENPISAKEARLMHELFHTLFP